MVFLEFASLTSTSLPVETVRYHTTEVGTVITYDDDDAMRCHGDPEPKQDHSEPSLLNSVWLQLGVRGSSKIFIVAVTVPPVTTRDNDFKWFGPTF